MNYGNIAYAVSDTGRIYYLLLFQTNSRGYKVRHRFGEVDVSELYHSLGNENTFDEALDYLKEPEIINTMIREAENGINGGEVFEIKDVYAITEYKDHYLIECDYIIGSAPKNAKKTEEYARIYRYDFFEKTAKFVKFFRS